MNGRPTAQTAADWLPVAAQIGDDFRGRMADRIAGIGKHAERTALRELSVQIGPQAEPIAPAWWDAEAAEVCVDTRIALPNTRAEHVNYADPAWRAEHLRIVGLVEHEVGHVLHTPRHALREWDAAGGDTLRTFGQHLEETRMEAATIAHGGDATALRAVANELVLRDFDTAAAAMSPRAANSLHLIGILGRSHKHGGSTPDAELQPYREAFQDLLGADTVAALEHELHSWNTTTRANFPHGAALLPMLERWKRIIGEETTQSEGAGEPQAGDQQAGDQGNKGDQAGDQGEPSEGAQEGDQAEEASTQAETGERAAQTPQPAESHDTSDQERQQRAAERIAEQLIERLDDAARAARQAARDQAGKAEQVDRRTLDEAVKGHGVGADSGHATVQLEPVTPDVRRLATQLARDFRKIATPQIKRTTQNSELPPGRLRGRGAVHRAAQAHAGMIPTAQPFTTTKRKRTHAPPPVIGIILDVSGSMDSARRPVAQVGYALAEAGRAVQARTAIVAMGSEAQLMTHHPTHVSLYDGISGAEDFQTAYGLIDARLHLSDRNTTGTRLLVVVTDARYGLDHAETTAQAVERELPKRGCGVLWICPTPTRFGIPVHHLTRATDPKGIAKAIERALTTVRSQA